jgi:hypothetical protein
MIVSRIINESVTTKANPRWDTRADWEDVTIPFKIYFVVFSAYLLPVIGAERRGGQAFLVVEVGVLVHPFCYLSLHCPIHHPAIVLAVSSAG